MLFIIYTSALCLANLSVAAFGPWITPVNAFFFIGLDMVLRDIFHERYGLIMSLMISTLAGAISYVVNPAAGLIAVASVVAFLCSSLVNGVVYQIMINKTWFTKSNAGNVAASAIDSMVFPVIAFGSFLPYVVLAQFTCKLLGGFIWSYVLRKIKK